jgi:hypothetical protein
MILHLAPAPRPAPLALDLIRQYLVPDPRYTSYPLATQLSNDLAALDLEGALRADNAPSLGSINIDLIFGLPHQHAAGFARPLGRCSPSVRTASPCSAPPTCRG